MRVIELTRGYKTIVDEEDYQLVSQYKWYAEVRPSGHVYAANKSKNNNLKLHRIITNAPKGLEVDHINHDTLDNRRSNLRLVTKSQNAMNKRKYKGESKYKGVTLHKPTGGFYGQIEHNKKRYRLGYFKSERQAACAYNAKAKQFFGKYALLNTINCPIDGLAKGFTHGVSNKE